MANGAKTEDFVVSRVRTGLKREFAFALKSRNEAVGGSLGRTRAGKNPSRGGGEKLPSSSKRVKKSSSSNASSDDGGPEENGMVPGLAYGSVGVVERIDAGNGSAACGAEPVKERRIHGESEEEQKSDVEDPPMSDDDNRCQSIDRLKEADSDEDNVGLLSAGDETKKGSGMEVLPLHGNIEPNGYEVEVEVQAVGDDASIPTPAKTSMIKSVPSKFKDLLETGLLEGFTVEYRRSARSKFQKDAGLFGVIQGCGVQCFCSECNGTCVVTPIKFEVHAGSANKRPADYIYLENGNSIRDVLNACKGSTLEDLEYVINCTIGRSSDSSCLSCRGTISEAGVGRVKQLCSSCIDLKTSQATPAPVAVDASQRQNETAPKSSNRSKESHSATNKSNGKVTRKFLGLHKSALHNDILLDGTELHYRSNAKAKTELTGYKQGSGIMCTHCQKTISPSQFEAHAGYPARKKPYDHIFTVDGVSLHDLSVLANKRRMLSTSENDELCSKCRTRGQVLCCAGCPRVYHLGCVELQIFPEESWYCRYCKNMYKKSAEHTANAVAAGRVAGVNPLEKIDSRCVRIVDTRESESGGCTLCRGDDFTGAGEGFGPRTVIICDQCEKEFHVGCLQSHGLQTLKALPEGAWFCCSDCNKIHSALQQLLEDGYQSLPDSSVDAVKKKYAEKGLDDESIDLKWRLLSGKISSDSEVRTLLAQVVSIFHEQFNPIVFPNETQDIIPHLIYGRKLKDIYFEGMYVAVLTVNSVTVSAGVFRVFGKEMAELPLVATASTQQKLGHFEALFTCMEKLLGDLDVKELWVPAAGEMKSFWTNKFSFLDVLKNEFFMRKKRYNVMTFDGTVMLRKDVVKSEPVVNDEDE